MTQEPAAFDAPASCQLCGAAGPGSALIPAGIVRPAIVELIRQEHPEIHDQSLLCSSDLNRFRALYVERLLAEEKGELSALEREVISRLREEELVSLDTNLEFSRGLTFGERLSDRIATFGGSWRFILIFGGVLMVWVLINTVVLATRAFDPYPFILLNLFLSCLAALQAPVIMMSQNRQEAKDRLRAEHDYRVNLKAELEIRMLSERVDRLLTHQWQRLLEIQQVQVDLIEQLGEKGRGHGRD